MSLQTSYPFVLPRGYVDAHGTLHKAGRMRLATARDELEPLRDPTVSGPDDPRLTVLVLARVVEQLGTLELITSHDIEGLFAIDLAFLQDFYGVINFGNQEEYEQLLRAQAEGPPLLGQGRPAAAVSAVSAAPVSASAEPVSASAEPVSAAPVSVSAGPAGFDGGDSLAAEFEAGQLAGAAAFASFGADLGGPGERVLSRRGAVEEIPRGK
ncbi:MAG TPA: hypothetical protein VFU36_16645 [Jatrophihabitans sp.]|nr:hypothetical protein [Jatrophihabitans sp.]